MQNTRRASIWLLTLTFLGVLILPLFLMGCGKEEKEDPNYYTGPMKPKSERLKNAKSPGGEGD